MKDPTSRIMRWRIKLEEYDYNIVYKPGKANSNADALSRNPPNSSKSEQTPSAQKTLAPHHTETDCDTPPCKRLQRVVIGANDSPLADSEKVENTDFNKIHQKNENLIANIFLTYGEKVHGQCEVVVEPDNFDDSTTDNDAYFTADEEEISPLLPVETPSKSEFLTEPNSDHNTVETCNHDIVGGGSLAGGSEDVLRLGCQLANGKVIATNPLQNPLGAVHVPRDAQALPDLLANGKVTATNPLQIRNLRSRACVTVGAEEPKGPATDVVVEAVVPDLFVTEPVKDLTRSSVNSTSKGNDLYGKNKIKILMTKTTPSTLTIPNPFPRILYSKQHLHTRRDNIIHFFSLDYKIDLPTHL